jgi:demethylmenaquinone methyltransferase/2-methoxy-6-polyprenyl-1,4-benzoquinol methylase
MAYLFNQLREPIFHSAIKVLQLPQGSKGLDAGCSVGLQTMMLSETVGSVGHVTGLDISPEALVCAEDLAEKAGLSDSISFKEGDINALPLDDDHFDWAWSMDLVGYAPIEPLPLIEELVRVVKPGGSVAILAWSSEMLLPGFPLLEARLKATSAGIAPFIKGKKPETHFTRALGWFRATGLRDCSVHTFVGDAHAPLSDDHRDALLALFQMRWPDVGSELTQEDWAEYQRLCLPESPDFILDRPDYYTFFTYTMFQGRVE